MVSDADSKALSSMEHVYGDIKVEKLDCAGHVQKRMGMLDVISFTFS
jgi:hypothetical protein